MNKKHYINLSLDDAKSILTYIQNVTPQLYVTECFVYDFPSSSFYEVQFSLNFLDGGILSLELLRRFNVSSDTIVFRLTSNPENISEYKAIGDKITTLYEKFNSDLKDVVMDATNPEKLIFRSTL